MPFTPFHLGPGLLLKAAAPRQVAFLGYAASQVVIDIESGYHLLVGSRLVHRELHTFTLGGLVGAISGLVATALARRVVPQLAGSPHAGLRSEASSVGGLLGGIAGGLFHSLLDGMMHGDIRPFRPFSTENPLLGHLSLDALHAVCVVSGVLGLLGLGLTWNRWRTSGTTR